MSLNLKVERLDDLRIEGEKRQQAPYRLSWNCPSCKKRHSFAYDGHQYLSYPVFGVPEKDVLYCGECETTVDVNITLDLVLTVTPLAPDDERKQRMAARP
jgi:hypothetical protein